MTEHVEGLIGIPREREHDEEDAFFVRGDRALIDKARGARDEELRTHLRQLAHMRCPDCAAHLASVAHHGVAVEECPAGHGMWLTEVEMRTIANRERHSWIARYFYGPPVASRVSADGSESSK